MADKMGVPMLARVDTVGVAPDFIAGLKEMVLDLAGKTGMMAEGGTRICPGTCGQCGLAEPTLSPLRGN